MADLVKKSEAGLKPALQLNQKEFLQTFSPIKCVTMFEADIIPLDCARRSDVPSLIDIKKQYGEDYLTGFVCLWITEILDYYGKKYPSENVINTIYIFKIDYIIQKNNHNRKSVLLHPLSGLRLLFL